MGKKNWKKNDSGVAFVCTLEFDDWKHTMIFRISHKEMMDKKQKQKKKKRNKKTNKQTKDG